jgi:eukaryotic-like serine/threonine-protein kinase
VDARSDVFSFGAVLYEMCTATLPCRGTTTGEIFDSTLNRAPLPPIPVNPAVPPKLDDTILNCLEKEPERRYQSAKELAVDLRRLRTPSTAVPVDVGRISRRRILFASVISLVALVVLLLSLNSGLRLGFHEPAAANVRSLAVLPLENLSHDPEQEYFAEGMTDALTTELAQIGALRVISRTSAMPYKDGRKSLPQIA